MAGVLLRQLRDHGLGRNEEAGDRCRVLQRAAHDFGRVDHALGDEIAVLVGLSVVAVAVLGVLKDLADDYRAVLTGVGEDLAGRCLKSLPDNGDTGLLILICGLQELERLDGSEQSDAAARDDAFLDGRAGRVESVVDAILALLDFDLGRAADL